MATIGRSNGAAFNNTSRLSYIATGAFDTYFFSYSTSINASLETVGTLATVVGATPVTCPKGRVLRENGRKLYPGANPGVSTYMVGVYDAQSMLNGFIDPNAKVFQIYNTDKPNFLADGVSGTTDLGPSVYTRGDLLAQGNLDISGSGHIYGDLDVGGAVDISGGLTVYAGETIKTGNLVVTAGNITVTSGNLTLTSGSATLTNGNLTITNGKLSIDNQSPNAQVGFASFPNSSSVVINTNACTSSSYVFVTLVGGGSAVLRVSATNNGSFTVSSNAGNTNDTFNWFVLN